jgi:hypothetical protein
VAPAVAAVAATGGLVAPRAGAGGGDAAFAAEAVALGATTAGTSSSSSTCKTPGGHQSQLFTQFRTSRTPGILSRSIAADFLSVEGALNEAADLEAPP